MGIELQSKLESTANGTAAHPGMDPAKDAEAPVSNEESHDAVPDNETPNVSEQDGAVNGDEPKDCTVSFGATDCIGNTDEKTTDDEEGQAENDGSDDGNEGEKPDEDDAEGEEDDDDEDDDSDSEYEAGDEDGEDEEDMDALRDAAKSGINANALAELMSKECFDTKAFLSAAADNDVETIKEFLNPNSDPTVDVNATDMFEYTALHMAAERGAVDAIKVLVEAGANLEMPSKMYSCRPLHYGKIVVFLLFSSFLILCFNPSPF